MAERQGQYLAKRLNKKTDEEFKYQSMGMMTYIGNYRALTDVPNVKMQGQYLITEHCYSDVHREMLGAPL